MKEHRATCHTGIKMSGKGLGSIRAIFGLIFKIVRIMSHDTKELSSLKNENNF